ncbi:MAG TPA: FkbM family methyltransferase, partial [Acidimicrobiales bacterium]|nr:FkbM family methyltransferase [Acidimicrobiales bacterium]
RSVHANGFSNVRLRNLCVGEHTAAAVFWMNWNEPIDFSLNRLDDVAASFSVLTVSIDDLFAWEGLDRLDYLKLDAIGSEELVLRGGRQTIEKYRPIIQLLASIDHSVSVRLDDYACFRSSHSPFKFYIPHQHDKVDVPKQLGWEALS